jgi:hypothetical protein
MIFLKNSRLTQIIAVFVFIALVSSGLGFGAKVANAASLTSISDTMSNETLSAVSSHVIKFTTPTGIAANKTFTIEFPTGFDFTSKATTTVTMSYGATTGTENALTLAGTATSANWGITFSGTKNATTTLTAPSSSNTIPAGNIVIITYSSANAVNPSSAANYTINLNNGTGAGTASDSGTVTVPIITSSQVAVSATVPQSLTFSLGSNSVALGTLSVSTVATGSHTMTLATNGTSGASVTVSGTTLTSGANTILACATGCTTLPGTAQFGLNLAANTSPSVGAAPTGSAPIGTVATNYGTVNSFRFVSGETVATAATPVNTTTYTVSYLANIAGVTPAGSYTTSLTYNATANF